jgi:hypothetical protein
VKANVIKQYVVSTRKPAKSDFRGFFLQYKREKWDTGLVAVTVDVPSLELVYMYPAASNKNRI